MRCDLGLQRSQWFPARFDKDVGVAGPLDRRERDEYDLALCDLVLALTLH